MKNETAAVVGVGPGLGAALVKRFAKDGFTTVAVARRASSLTSLRGGDDPVISYDCDATAPEQVERLFQKIQSDYGPLCGVPPVPRTIYGLGFKPCIAVVAGSVLNISSSRS